jgi:hypothetical protein
MAKFLIGHFEFPTKYAAKAEVRRILHGVALDEKLQGREASLVRCLYAKHPRSKGEPVAFCVGTNNYHGALTRGFHAVMADGTRLQWSYVPCLSARADEPSLLRAMRAAIMLSQREALRAAYVGRALIRCNGNCGRSVPLAEAHVHHLSPKFIDIADHFVSLIGMPAVQHSDDLGDEFAEIDLKKRWIMFHDSVAQRVVVCAKCNAEAETRDGVLVATDANH